MANVDHPNGFHPSRHLMGGVVRANEYEIASGYATDIFSGDPVKLVTAGVIELSAPGNTNNIGVFDGVEWIAPDGEVKYSRYWPANTTVKAGTKPKAYVYDDPNIAFRVQTASGAAFAQAMVGANADIKADHAGDTSTGSSGKELDISAPAATTAQCRILGLINEPGNDYGENADIEVMFVEHLLRPAGTTGI